MASRSLPVTESCDTLSHRELMAKLGIRRSTFYVWLKEGRLDHLRCQSPLDFKFSRVKVDRWLASPSTFVQRQRLKAAS